MSAGEILLIDECSLQIINDDGILVVSHELDVRVKMTSTSWTRALERFDRDVDLNSLTKKEVREETRSLASLISTNLLLDRQFIESSF